MNIKRILLIKNIDKIKLKDDEYFYHAGTKKMKIKFIQMAVEF